MNSGPAAVALEAIHSRTVVYADDDPREAASQCASSHHFPLHPSIEMLMPLKVHVARTVAPQFDRQANSKRGLQVLLSSHFSRKSRDSTRHVPHLARRTPRIASILAHDMSCVP